MRLVRSVVFARAFQLSRSAFASPDQSDAVPPNRTRRSDCDSVGAETGFAQLRAYAPARFRANTVPSILPDIAATPPPNFTRAISKFLFGEVSPERIIAKIRDKFAEILAKLRGVGILSASQMPRNYSLSRKFLIRLPHRSRSDRFFFAGTRTVWTRSGWPERHKGRNRQKRPRQANRTPRHTERMAAADAAPDNEPRGPQAKGSEAATRAERRSRAAKRPKQGGWASEIGIARRRRGEAEATPSTDGGRCGAAERRSHRSLVGRVDEIRALVVRENLHVWPTSVELLKSEAFCFANKTQMVHNDLFFSHRLHIKTPICFCVGGRIAVFCCFAVR